MKVSYKGVKQELPSKIQEKLDAKFSKLSKLLERRGEREAHVVVTTERHLHKAEITLPFYDHQLVCVGSDSDLFTALSMALDKLEKQAVKLRDKWREKKRRADSKNTASEPAEIFPSADSGDDRTRLERHHVAAGGVEQSHHRVARAPRR